MFGRISSDGLLLSAQKLVQQKHLESPSLDRPTVNIQPSDELTKVYFYLSLYIRSVLTIYWASLNSSFPETFSRFSTLRPLKSCAMNSSFSVLLKWSKRFQNKSSVWNTFEYHKIMNNTDLYFLLCCAKNDFNVSLGVWLFRNITANLSSTNCRIHVCSTNSDWGGNTEVIAMPALANMNLYHVDHTI